MNLWEYNETELWRFNTDGVSIMHVFGSIAFGRNVIVFCEAREGDGSDIDSPHSIYMRRSDNGGKSFYDTVKLIPSHGNCYVNPTPLYNAQTRRLFLFFAQQLGNNKTQNYIMYSDNAGITWSRPQNITAALESDESSRFHLPGPGHGIQLDNGRLMMQFWHRTFGTDVPKELREYQISYLYSDDNGKTWNHSGLYAKNCHANESRFVQTNSRIIWNVRTISKQRYEAYSVDGGVSWSKFIPAPVTQSCLCDCSMVSLNAKNGYEDTVLFSRASHIDLRRDMEILISRDGGLSYDEKFTLIPGDAVSAYSDLCIINESEPVIGLVQCRNNHVFFTRISLQTLTNGKYDNVYREVWLDK